MTLYLEHFGLREAPFKITPTTEFFYSGGRRGEILHALQYAINSGEGIMMVTGEVGSGKTMLLRTLLEKLSREQNTDIVYIPNPSLAGREILYHICEELELRIDHSRPDTVRMLQNHLIERCAQGRRVIAFIDEAQAMPEESLEEIRLLSNLETARNKLLQIALFGQPELDDKLLQHNMRQLRERITLALELKPFGHNDIREYISTRLRAAGYNGGQLFSDDALKLIAAISQGLSRRINVLADKAMLSAFERLSLSVQYADAKRAAQDVRFGKLRYRSEQSKRFSRRMTMGLSLASAALIAIAAVSHWTTTVPLPPSPIAALTQQEEPAQPETQPQTQTQPEAQNALPDIAGEPQPEGGLQTAAASPAPEQVIIEKVATVIVERTITTSVVVEQKASPEEMRAAILSLQTSQGAVRADALAEEIAAAAEEHGDAPQNEGGAVPQWQAAALRPRDELVDNPDWHWMPEESYLRSRLNATQTWLSREDGRRGYTARLITVSQRRAVFLEKFLRHFADFYPIRNVMVYPARIGDSDRFVVTFGVYQTRRESEVFIANIPSYFTGGKPFAQPLAESARESSAL